ncbi:MAG: Rid family hydrolase [Acidobacteriota bacterium]|nr:Rid family hydrolase [Acidobacteriota bacterium]
MKLLVPLCLLGALAIALWFEPNLQAKKKKKEEITQVLELPKDPPSGVVAETRRMVFRVSPLSGKGLLSQQTRDALKSLLRTSNGESIVKIRAFVAGSGDLRRVPAIVSEVFTEKHLALPAVSVVLAGGLPLESAQLVLESTAISKREVNPSGLLFISGQASSSEKPLEPTTPLAEKSLASLKTAVVDGGSAVHDVLRVTCFSSSLDDAARIHGMMSTHFPQAAINLVKSQRAPSNTVVECEAVARLQRPSSSPVEFLSPAGLTHSTQYSQIARVSATRLVLTGTQVAFGFQEADAKLAFERLRKALDQLGSSPKNVVMASIYPLSASIGEQVRKIRFQFFDSGHPPASTLLPFEGLPSMDASFAIDVAAVVNQ